MQLLSIAQISITRGTCGYVCTYASVYTHASTALRAQLTSRCLLRRVNNVGVAAMHDEFCLECWHDRKAASSRRYTLVVHDAGYA